MSEAQRLEKLIREKPALADVPILTVKGKLISPREALGMMRQGLNVSEIRNELAKKSLTSHEQARQLTLEHYRRLLQQKERPNVLWFQMQESPFPVPSSPEELLNELEKNTPLAKQIIDAHIKFLREVVKPSL